MALGIRGRIGDREHQIVVQDDGTVTGDGNIVQWVKDSVAKDLLKTDAEHRDALVAALTPLFGDTIQVEDLGDQPTPTPTPPESLPTSEHGTRTGGEGAATPQDGEATPPAEEPPEAHRRRR